MPRNGNKKVGKGFDSRTACFRVSATVEEATVGPAAAGGLEEILIILGFGEPPPLSAIEAKSEAIVLTPTSAGGGGTFVPEMCSKLLSVWSIKNITLIIAEVILISKSYNWQREENLR